MKISLRTYYNNQTKMTI